MREYFRDLTPGQLRQIADIVGGKEADDFRQIAARLDREWAVYSVDHPAYRVTYRMPARPEGVPA